MAEETLKRSFNWRRWIAVLAAAVLSAATFPHLRPFGLVITDCTRGGCAFPTTPGAEEYEVSCKGNESIFGPALTVDAGTCQVTSHSLTLASSWWPDIPANWDGKLRVCPTTNP